NRLKFPARGGRWLRIEKKPPNTLVVIGEEEAAIGADRTIDQREIDGPSFGIARARFRVSQNFHGGLPAGAVASQKEGDQTAGGAVLIIRRPFPTVTAHQKRVVILGGKLRVLVESAPSGRAAPDRKDGRKGIQEIIRISAHFLPALITTDG